jgi:hypothetical protein
MGRGGFNAIGESGPSMSAVTGERKSEHHHLMEGTRRGGDAASFCVLSSGREGAARRHVLEFDGGGCL